MYSYGMAALAQARQDDLMHAAEDARATRIARAGRSPIVRVFGSWRQRPESARPVARGELRTA